MKIEIVFLGSHLASSVVPYWKMDDFGGVGVSGLVGAWLAGRVCKKCWNQKILLEKSASRQRRTSLSKVGGP